MGQWHQLDHMHHLHFVPDTQSTHYHSIFTGRVLFQMLNQTTERKNDVDLLIH